MPVRIGIDLKNAHVAAQTSRPFHAFGVDHWAVLILTALAGFAMIFNAKKIRTWADDRALCIILAVVIVLNEVIAFFFYLSVGEFRLPLQLCDLSVFLVAWALLSRSRLVGETAFFWTLGGGLQAVLTPDLELGFPSFQFCQFFFSHCMIILAAIYLVIRGTIQIRVSSVWRAWAMTNAYVAVAGIINWIFGLNIGYVAAKPPEHTILDFFGPWPYYIFAMEFVVIGLFFICYGFGRFLDYCAGGSQVFPSGRDASATLK